MSEPTIRAHHTSATTRRHFLGALLAGSGAALLSQPLTLAFGGADPELKAQRLSWAGVKLELPSMTLFIDPLISPGVWDDALKQPLIPVEASTPQRHVMITHLHPDHFDPAAVKKILTDSGYLICHIDGAATAASHGFRVWAAKLYEPMIFGDFTLVAVPAVDGYNSNQVSWVVTGGGKRVIHCGDTMWHGAWWQIGRQYGPFDAAFLPINGAKFSWRQPASDIPAVLTPDQAVAAGVVLGAKLVTPIHYGVSGAEGYEEQANAETSFIETARKRKLPLEILKPGEWMKWKGNA
jgi:L-ascorbate metabolism protein UlaG (beta-lactamase superfamily)